MRNKWKGRCELDFSSSCSHHSFAGPCLRIEKIAFVADWLPLVMSMMTNLVKPLNRVESKIIDLLATCLAFLSSRCRHRDSRSLETPRHISSKSNIRICNELDFASCCVGSFLGRHTFRTMYFSAISIARCHSLSYCKPCLGSPLGLPPRFESFLNCPGCFCFLCTNHVPQCHSFFLLLLIPGKR